MYLRTDFVWKCVEGGQRAWGTWVGGSSNYSSPSFCLFFCCSSSMSLFWFGWGRVGKEKVRNSFHAQERRKLNTRYVCVDYAICRFGSGSILYLCSLFFFSFML